MYDLGGPDKEAGLVHHSLLQTTTHTRTHKQTHTHTLSLSLALSISLSLSLSLSLFLSLDKVPQLVYSTAGETIFLD